MVNRYGYQKLRMVNVVVWYCVFVHSNVCQTQCCIGFFTSQFTIREINEEQVVFSTARHDLVTTRRPTPRPSLSSFHDLLLVSFEFWFHRFFERYRFTSNNMHQRAARERGSTAEFSLCKIFIIHRRQDQTTTWAGQCLMGS